MFVMNGADFYFLCFNLLKFFDSQRTVRKTFLEVFYLLNFFDMNRE